MSGAMVRSDCHRPGGKHGRRDFAGSEFGYSLLGVSDAVSHVIAITFEHNVAHLVHRNRILLVGSCTQYISAKGVAPYWGRLGWHPIFYSLAEEIGGGHCAAACLWIFDLYWAHGTDTVLYR